MTKCRKPIEQHFVDWEEEVIGYGYGSGEPHTIPALRRFLELCNGGVHGNCYSYEKLEEVISPATVWLLISILINADILEYGTSPRYAWLTECGMKLRDFTLSRTADELVSLVVNRGNDYFPCTPRYCNCDLDGYQPGRVCPNPFWQK